jgi:hypothetical protein
MRTGGEQFGEAPCADSAKSGGQCGIQPEIRTRIRTPPEIAKWLIILKLLLAAYQDCQEGV